MDAQSCMGCWGQRGGVHEEFMSDPPRGEWIDCSRCGGTGIEPTWCSKCSEEKVAQKGDVCELCSVVLEQEKRAAAAAAAAITISTTAVEIAAAVTAHPAWCLCLRCRAARGVAVVRG